MIKPGDLFVFCKLAELRKQAKGPPIPADLAGTPDIVPRPVPKAVPVPPDNPGGFKFRPRVSGVDAAAAAAKPSSWWNLSGWLDNLKAPGEVSAPGATPTPGGYNPSAAQQALGIPAKLTPPTAPTPGGPALSIGQRLKQQGSAAWRGLANLTSTGENIKGLGENIKGVFNQPAIDPNASWGSRLVERGSNLGRSAGNIVKGVGNLAAGVTKGVATQQAADYLTNVIGGNEGGGAMPGSSFMGKTIPGINYKIPTGLGLAADIAVSSNPVTARAAALAAPAGALAGRAYGAEDDTVFGRYNKPATMDTGPGSVYQRLYGNGAQTAIQKSLAWDKAHPGMRRQLQYGTQRFDKLGK